MTVSPSNQRPGLIICLLALLTPSLECCGRSRAPLPHSFQVWGHQAESHPGRHDLQADNFLTSCAVAKRESQRVAGKESLPMISGRPRVFSLGSLLASAGGHGPAPFPFLSPLWP